MAVYSSRDTLSFMMTFKDEAEFKSSCGYEIEGIWYPRVTKIVDIKSKPALYRFYASVGYMRALEISEKSAEEGTAVHAAVERLLTGQKAGEVPASIGASVYAFLNFMRENKIQVDPVHVERRAVSEEHRYAGTIDSLAVIDGKFGVLDIKTSAGIYRDYDLQTAAYFQALKKEFPELSTRWILRIDQNQKCAACNATRRVKGGREKIKKNSKKLCGNFSHQWQEPEGVVELKEITSDPEHDFAAFLGAKKLWEWENKPWLDLVGY